MRKFKRRSERTVKSDGSGKPQHYVWRKDRDKKSRFELEQKIKQMNEGHKDTKVIARVRRRSSLL